MAAASDGNNSSDESFTLKEFVECYDLPKWVSVVGGKDVGSETKKSCNIQKGDILMLRTLAVESVALSFNDTDTGVKRLVRVTPDTQVKFKVLLPSPDFKNPKGKRTVFKTVTDLLKVCPTYFQANVSYDDPYLPSIVRSGEVFRFIRQIRKKADRKIYLQCEDGDGHILELPEEVAGEFTAVDDTKSYTLKEILDLGAVNRKLKLCEDIIQRSIAADSDNAESYYGNLSHSSGTTDLQRIMGLPLTYDGLLTFHKPDMFLVVSPSDNAQAAWKLPLGLDINFQHFIPDDYEKPGAPVQRMYKLKELIDTFHDELPVLATLVHYKDMPTEFVHCLKPGEDVLIHSIDKEDKLLAKSDDMHFCISRELNGRLRKTLRKFNSFEELKSFYVEGDEILVKLLQDVASDWPVPYSLQAGDVLKIKSMQTKMHEVKTKSKKTFGPFGIIKCQKRKDKGGFEKYILPDDLEVTMHEIPSPDKVGGFSACDVFKFKPELPFSVDFLADYGSIWSCLPVYSEISLTNFVSESLAVISPVIRSDADEKTIDPKVRACLCVPVRHHVMFTIKDCLGFPPGYFQYPDRSVYVSAAVEKISKMTFDDIIRHNDMAYEDYDAEEPPSPAASGTPNGSHLLLPIRASKSQTMSKEAKHVSRSFTNILKGKRTSALLNKFRRDKTHTDKNLTLSVGNQTYQVESDPGTGISDEYEDDHVYESYHFSNGSPS